MSNIEFSFGNHSLNDFINFWQFEDNPQITTSTSDQITVVGSGYNFTLYGSFIGGNAALSSVSGIDVSYYGSQIISVSEVWIPITDFLLFQSFGDLVNVLETEMAGDDEFVSDLNVDLNLNLSSGNDVAELGSGDDFVFAGTGNDRVMSGSGDDIVNGDSGHDRLWGGAGQDQIHGQTGRDILNGGGGNDELNGGIGRDILKGGSGHDTLIAGRGNDRLNGNTGDDTFVFKHRDGANVIRDFGNGSDAIEIQHGARGMRGLTFNQDGDDVQIAYAQTTIIVRDWEVEDLQSEDFFLFT